MKNKTFTGLILSALLLTGLSGCEKTKNTETTATTTDTTTVTHRETRVRTKADDDVRDFKNWVNEKTSRADSNAKEKWPEIKQDFKTRTNQLESQLDSFSTDSRREYEESKARFKAWENRRDMRTAQPLDEAKLVTWRKTLLGDFNDLKTVTATNVKEAYLTFMGSLRAKKAHWTQDDWDYVDHVYGELNNRKSEINSSISTADALKIKTLQTEYLTLETAADVKDVSKEMKK